MEQIHGVQQTQAETEASTEASRNARVIGTAGNWRLVFMDGDTRFVVPLTKSRALVLMKGLLHVLGDRHVPED